jgi:hypothetical protein
LCDMHQRYARAANPKVSDCFEDVDGRAMHSESDGKVRSPIQCTRTGQADKAAIAARITRGVPRFFWLRRNVRCDILERFISYPCLYVATHASVVDSAEVRRFSTLAIRTSHARIARRVVGVSTRSPCVHDPWPSLWGPGRTGRRERERGLGRVFGDCS